jgi:hypothetical protein
MLPQSFPLLGEQFRINERYRRRLSRRPYAGSPAIETARMKAQALNVPKRPRLTAGKTPEPVVCVTLAFVERQNLTQPARVKGWRLAVY